MLAAGNGHKETVEVLLKAGVDVHAETSEGDTAIHYAAYGIEGADTTKMLLEAGADASKRNRKGFGQYSPLIYAAASGAQEIIKVLLDAGADIDARDEHGNTALMYTITGHRKLQKILISHGIDVNAKGQGGTALSFAREAGYVDTVELLRRAGARE